MRVLHAALAAASHPVALLHEALKQRGHDSDLVVIPVPTPPELDPIAYPDLVEENARGVFARAVRRARPDGVVVAAEDSFLLGDRAPLPHPRTLIVGTGAVTLAPSARAHVKQARGLVLGVGRAVGGVSALIDGLTLDAAPPERVLVAIERWVAEAAAALTAWRAKLDQPVRSRSLYFAHGGTEDDA